MTLQPGTSVGRYEILEPLGAGGMGEVYRARDAALGRDVAIKVLPASMVADPDSLARFEQEARAASQINHPNILTTYDVGAHEGAPYIVSELLEGETLRDQLRGGPLAERRATEYAAQAARGLAAAHAKGIIHRDLKPDNLFVTADGRVKILDFGLAKLREGTDLEDAETMARSAIPVTAAGTILGTVGYMSPEQVRGQPIDPRSDLFSLGVVLYEMLSGRRPFEGETAADTMSAILTKDPSELTAIQPDLPPTLDRLVRHCLEKRPEERYQSAGDLAFELEGRTWRSSSAMAAMPEAPAPGTRRPGVAGAIVVALALMAAVFLAGRALAPAPGPTGPIRFQQQTFRRGNILRAQFSRDGRTIVYGASWEGRPAELYSTRTDAAGSTELGLLGADLLSVSAGGEMAILLKQGFLGTTSGTGILARVPLTGGTPRELMRYVVTADWAPDGESLAVVRYTEEGPRLEYPIGKVLRKGLVARPRVSPDGGRVAFIHDGSIGIIDVEGKERVLTGGWGYLEIDSLAWSPSGDEILFVGGPSMNENALRAVDMKGRARVLLASLDPIVLHDVAADGRILLERESYRYNLFYGSQGEKTARDLSWMSRSVVTDLSADGKTILFEDGVKDASGGPDIFLRRSDGSPAIHLGRGQALAISPDANWVLQAGPGDGQATLLPTGPGEPRLFDYSSWATASSPVFLPDSQGFLFLGRAREGDPLAIFRKMIHDDAPPEPLVADVPDASGMTISPDGRRVALRYGKDQVRIQPLDGGEPQILTLLSPTERPVQWGADGGSLMIAEYSATPTPVFRLDLATGSRTLWRTLSPPDPSGYVRTDDVIISRDGRSWAYTCLRIATSDLYVVEGLR